MRIVNEPGPDDPVPGTENMDEAEERTETVPTELGPDEVDVEGDVVTDPALDDRVGSDWADEGGATPEGPATSTD